MAEWSKAPDSRLSVEYSGPHNVGAGSNPASDNIFYFILYSSAKMFYVTDCQCGVEYMPDYCEFDLTDYMVLKIMIDRMLKTTLYSLNIL